MSAVQLSGVHVVHRARGAGLFGRDRVYALTGADLTVAPGEVHAVLVSAHTGEGVDELRALIADQLPRPGVAVDVVVPYHRGDLVSRVHEHGDIDHEEHTEHGTVLRARVDAQLAAELQAASVA